MTFTEAALEVLRREGKPLHFKKIAELAVRESLLDHVGKIPDEVMADQLAAHARLPKLERRLIPVQPGTFALAEWGLDEDPAGLDGLLEARADEGLPYRNRERHPIPSRDLSRAPRNEQREPREQRPRRDDERHGRRFPPPSEVAYEILAGAGKGLRLVDIAAQGVERLLMPEAFVRDAGSLLAALTEDNHRREAAGRQPLFAVNGDSVTLLAQPEPGERPVAAIPPRLGATAADLRRAALAAIRRRMREADGATVEWIAGRLLEKLGYRELKSAKRGREHVIFTARRRMGLADLRHCVRILRVGADATRRDVTELRRDLGHYGAQIGVVITAGDAVRDARAEATAAGQLPIVLLCGEAFAEALAEAGVGTVPVVVPELDESFFKAAVEAGEKDELARRARREERDRDESREGREPRDAREPREGREPRDAREPREGREPRDARESREGREPRDAREPREGREPRDAREPREGRDRERGERRDRRDEPRRGRERQEGRAEGREPTEVPAPAEGTATKMVAGEDETERAASAFAAAGTDRTAPEPLLLMAHASSSPQRREADEDVDEGTDADAEGDELAGDAPEGQSASGEPGEASAQSGDAPGQSGERRRRRRRRRRGGRGRGREGGAGTQGAPQGAAPGMVAAGEGAQAATQDASPQPVSEQPAMEPARGEPSSRHEEPSSGDGEA
jgi:ribonuclease E